MKIHGIETSFRHAVALVFAVALLLATVPLLWIAYRLAAGPKVMSFYEFVDSSFYALICNGI